MATDDRYAGIGDLPAGMRNNNPGNIKYLRTLPYAGITGPSVNTDQGDPQAVFESPELGMLAAYQLALRKYGAGKTTANQLIAGRGGWTPGNMQAAANVASMMGIHPDEDLNLNDPTSAQRFLRSLVTQEQGQAGGAYGDDMIAGAVQGIGGAPAPAPRRRAPRLKISPEAAVAELLRRGKITPEQAAAKGYGPPPAAPEDTTPSWFGEAGRGFARSAASAPGDITSGAGAAIGAAGMPDTAAAIEGLADRLRPGDDTPGPTVPTMADIDSLGDVGRYVFGAVGSGVGSTIPPILGGVAGAGIGAVAGGGAGALPGAIAGAGATSYLQNTGQLAADLREQGIDPQAARQWAATFGAPIAALDVIGVGKALGIPRREVERAVVRSLAGKIASGAIKGGTAEGLTEAAQQTLQEVAGNLAGGDRPFGQSAMNVAEASVQGLLGGTAMGTIANRERVAPEAQPEEQPAAAEPEMQAALPPPDYKDPVIRPLIDEHNSLAQRAQGMEERVRADPTDQNAASALGFLQQRMAALKEQISGLRSAAITPAPPSTPAAPAVPEMLALPNPGSVEPIVGPVEENLRAVTERLEQMRLRTDPAGKQAAQFLAARQGELQQQINNLRSSTITNPPRGPEPVKAAAAFSPDWSVAQPDETEMAVFDGDTDTGQRVFVRQDGSFRAPGQGANVGIETPLSSLPDRMPTPEAILDAAKPARVENPKFVGMDEAERRRQEAARLEQEEQQRVAAAEQQAETDRLKFWQEQVAKFRSASPVQARDSLLGFIREQGGINRNREGGQDVVEALRDMKLAPGTLRGIGGLAPDEVTLRAWEAGYLPGEERPEMQALYDALRASQTTPLLRPEQAEQLRERERFQAELTPQMEAAGVTATMTPRQAAERLRDWERQQQSGGAGFTTAKGSTYVVNDDGSTTRNKAYRPEHGAAEQGPQPKSEKTFYVTPEQAEKLAGIQARGGPKVRVTVRDGHAAIQYAEGPEVGKVWRDSVVRFQSQPSEGLIPVEIWDGGSKVHFGNKITEVRRADEIPPDQLPAKGEPMQDIPFQRGAAGETETPVEPGLDTLQRGDIQFARNPASRGARMALEDRLRPIMRNLFGQQVKIEASEQIRDWKAPGRPPAIKGAYSPSERVIHIAMKADSANQTDLPALYHEGIHHLRNMNVFTPREWKVLAAEARRSWIDKYDLPRRYSGADPDLMTEEGIAEGFAHWMDGEKVPAPVRGVFQKIKTFFARARNLAKGMGFQTADDVLRRVGSGEVGKRPAKAPRTVEVKRLQPSAKAAPTRPASMAQALQEADEERLGKVGDALAAALGKVKPGVDAASIARGLDGFRNAIQDNFTPVRRAQEAAMRRRGTGITDRENVYRQQEFYSGRVADRSERLQREHVAPMLEAMTKAKISIPEMSEYLYARHAPERNAQMSKINPKFKPGEGSGMTDAQAADVMSKIRRAGRMADFERIAGQVDAMRKQTLNGLVTDSLLSADQAAQWQKLYPNYVPLKGFEGEDDMADVMPHVSGGYQVRGAESKRATGRGSKAADVLENVIMQAQEGIVRGEKNRVFSALHQLVENNPDPDYWRVDPVTVRPVFNKRTGLIEYRRQAQNDDPKTVWGKIDGKQVRVRLEDKRLLQSLKQLDAERMGAVIRAMAGVTRFLSMLNTSLSPEFVVSNAFRDVIQSQVTGQRYNIPKFAASMRRNYFKALKGAYGGLKGAEKTEWQKLFQQYSRLGGRVGFARLESLNDIRARMAREIKGHGSGPWQGTKRRFFATVDYIGQVNGAVDNAIRLAAFKTAIDAGMSPQQAASIGKNITVNFNRHGTVGPLANAFYMFFNAGVQGNQVLLSAIKGSRKVQKMVAAVVAAGAMQEIGNRMFGGQDEDGEDLYDKIGGNPDASDFLKSTNAIFMIPGAGKEDWNYVRIPLPYGLNVFWNMGRNAAASMMGRQSAARSLGNIATAAADAFNPVGGAENLISMMSPTLMDPLVDIYLNENFAGAPVHPQDTDRTLPQSAKGQYWASASPISVFMARSLNEVTGGNDFAPGSVNVNPNDLDHAFGSYAGSAGGLFSRLLASGTRLVGLGDDPTAPVMRFNDIPFARRVAGSTNSNFDRSAFYERRDQLQIVENQIKGFAEAGQHDEVRRVRQENKALLPLIPMADRVQKDLAAIRKARSAVIENQTMRPDTRKARLDQLKEREQQILLTFNTRWVAAQEAA